MMRGQQKLQLQSLPSSQQPTMGTKIQSLDSNNNHNEAPSLRTPSSSPSSSMASAASVIYTAHRSSPVSVSSSSLSPSGVERSSSNNNLPVDLIVKKVKAESSSPLKAALEGNNGNNQGQQSHVFDFSPQKRTATLTTLEVNQQQQQDSNSSSNPEMYSNLIKRLRQHIQLTLPSNSHPRSSTATTNAVGGGSTGSSSNSHPRSSAGGSASNSPPPASKVVTSSTLETTTSHHRSSTSSSSSSGKLSAAARKEKLKLQTCYQCPICKKRFQRHIALNAHFQSEHIGHGATTKNANGGISSTEKICRVCNFRASNMAEVRQHLLKDHNVDLDTPGACLAEPETHQEHQQQQQQQDQPQVIHLKQEPQQQVRSEQQQQQPPVSLALNKETKISLVTSSSPIPQRQQQASALAAADDVKLQQQYPNNHQGLSLVLPNLPPGIRLTTVPAATTQTVVSVTQQHQADVSEVPQDLSMKKTRGENNGETSTKSQTEATASQLLRELRSPIPSVAAGYTDRSGAVLIRKLPIEQQAVVEIPKAVAANSVSAAAAVVQPKSQPTPKRSPAAGGSPDRFTCTHCNIIFPNQTLYFLHRGFHGDSGGDNQSGWEESNPWKCNGCGLVCSDMYDFNTHLVSDPHN